MRINIPLTFDISFEDIDGMETESQIDATLVALKLKEVILDILTSEDPSIQLVEATSDASSFLITDFKVK